MSKPLDYLQWLTDDFGIWQHTNGDEIYREMGYALDDAARGLIVFLQFGDTASAKVCLDYLETAQTAKGFVGFFDQHRSALSDSSSYDARALAIWALDYAIAHKFHAAQAKSILSKSPIDDLIAVDYIRTHAYLLLAACEAKDKKLASTLAKSITKRFTVHEGPDKVFAPTYHEQIGDIAWFEERLTYANAIIPYALLYYEETFQIDDATLTTVIQAAISTLEHYCRIGVIPAPVGNRIWQKVGVFERDIYGQQPIDAGFMVMLLTKAYEVYKDDDYRHRAHEWMDWFTGNNIFRANLITPQNACIDGLYTLPRGVCKNKGAESTIVYLMALYAARNITKNEKVSV